VGDGDGGVMQAVRLARRRAAHRHPASVAQRPGSRRPSVSCRRRRRCRLSARARRPDATVLERRRVSAADVRRHQRFFGRQERRLLPAAGFWTRLATLTEQFIHHILFTILVW